jgi:hypothetical protein
MYVAHISRRHPKSHLRFAEVDERACALEDWPARAHGLEGVVSAKIVAKDFCRHAQTGERLDETEKAPKESHGEAKPRGNAYGRSLF